MTIVDQIFLFFGNYTSLVSFFGAIIGGEETLVVLAILAAHGYISILSLGIFFYLGIVVSDLMWYSLGRSRIFNWIIKRKSVSKIYYYWDKLLNKSTKGNNFQALLITKFLYGLRLPTIMYLARERMKLKSFFFYTLIVDAIWVSAILIIGWFAGKGISLATNLSDNIILFLVLIGVTLVLFTLLVKFISEVTKRWLIRKQK